MRLASLCLDSIDTEVFNLLKSEFSSGALTSGSVIERGGFVFPFVFALVFFHTVSPFLFRRLRLVGLANLVQARLLELIHKGIDTPHCSAMWLVCP